MKVTKTAVNQSLIKRFNPHYTIESIAKFLPFGTYEMLSQAYKEADRIDYTTIVSVASYAQGNNKTISQAANDVMRLLNDGQLRFVGEVASIHFFEWVNELGEPLHNYWGEEEIPAAPYDLMIKLEGLKGFDSFVECDGVELEVSVNEHLKKSLSLQGWDDSGTKENKIVLLNVMTTAFEYLQSNPDHYDNEYLKKSLNKLAYCYQTMLLLSKERKKNSNRMGREQVCYAYYDLKSNPPKFVGLGVTGSNPYSFIYKTLKYTHGIMRVSSKEFECKVVDDKDVVKEINRIAKATKPYTKFLAANNGNFYVGGRFSHYYPDTDDSEGATFRGLSPSFKIETDVIKSDDYIWKWQNRPRVISPEQAHWRKQEDSDSDRYYYNFQYYTNEEKKALNTNYIVLSEELTFDILVSGERGITVSDVFSEAEYKLSSDGDHVLSYQSDVGAFKIKIGAISTEVTTEIKTESGSKSISATLTYKGDDIEHNSIMYWIELYYVVNGFVHSPVPLNYDNDIYKKASKKYTERDLFESELRLSFCFNTRNFWRRFYFDVDVH